MVGDRGKELNVLTAGMSSKFCGIDISTKGCTGDSSSTENTSPSGLSQEIVDLKSSTSKPFLAMKTKAPALKSVLIPLKTTLETKARDRTVEVYVTTIPVKLAHGTLILIRSLVPDDGGLNLQHLRRFAKHADVPESVRSAFHAVKSEAVGAETERSSHYEAPENLFLVVGSINSVSHTTLVEALSATVSNVTLFKIPVPLLAPTSQEQATRLSSQYWPTVYKKSNPFGPHPSIVCRAEEEIQGDVQKWMTLAEDVAKQSCEAGSGECIGVVIVERRNGVAKPVAVAGDARWLGWPRSGCGNVSAHAAMRGIAMVAAGLRSKGEVDEIFAEISTLPAEERIASQMAPPSDMEGENDKFLASPPQHDEEGSQNKASSPSGVEIFQDRPLLKIEEDNLGQSSNGDGYLCHELEIYCTHEPCVMCSMAIVHSRFCRVVFARRMHETGGLCADGALGHGLFWRKELNWTMLAWHWGAEIPDEQGYSAEMHA